jgi:hypothetical protein
MLLVGHVKMWKFNLIPDNSSKMEINNHYLISLVKINQDCQTIS